MKCNFVRILIFTVALIGASEAEAQSWSRIGLEWSIDQAPPPPPCCPVVDKARVEEQIEAGCGESNVRFADTAPMRGTIGGEVDWPAPVRRLTALASFSDDYDVADHALAQALMTEGLSPLQKAILENQSVLIALQFEHPDDALSRLNTIGLPSDIPAALVADRLFWTAIIEAGRASSATTWRNEISPLLDRAYAADPLAFQVRVWRLLTWLKGAQWVQSSDCDALIRTYSTLVLDVSEASACPLMIGHLTHRLDREFAVRSDDSDPPRKAVEAWLKFTVGLLARVVGADAVAESMTISLMNAKGVTCAKKMAHEILALEASK